MGAEYRYAGRENTYGADHGMPNAKTGKSESLPVVQVPGLPVATGSIRPPAGHADETTRRPRGQRARVRPRGGVISASSGSVSAR
jgi:hypothetical protein